MTTIEKYKAAYEALQIAQKMLGELGVTETGKRQRQVIRSLLDLSALGENFVPALIEAAQENNQEQQRTLERCAATKYDA